MSFSVFWNFSWFVHGYVHKNLLEQISCKLYFIVSKIRLKARTITTIYRILLVQLILNRL